MGPRSSTCAGSKYHSRNSCRLLISDLLCTTSCDGTDLCRSNGAVVALPGIREKVSPCLKVAQQQPQTYPGCSTAMPASLPAPGQVRITLHNNFCLWKAAYQTQ